MAKKECCTILGQLLDPKKNWVTNVRKNGSRWIPMFLEYVDPEKCIGCGLCVKVCTGGCYEMQEKTIKGKTKRISVAVAPENCLGDCSCHLICPVPGGAMVCKPKLIKK
jgi:NAD-dependent dihydropyrimidine dehydrogenase PreA subunit